MLKNQPVIHLLQLMLASGNGGAETFFEKLTIAFQEAGIPQSIIIAKNEERKKRLKDAGCTVIEIPAKGLQKYLIKPRLQKLANEIKPTHALAWMNRAASNMPQGTFIKLARLGGYYKLKNYKNCDHLIGITPKICDYLIKEGWPEEKLSHISSFGEIPDQGYATCLKEELCIPPEHKVLLSLGRLHEVKAQDIIIKALKNIPDCTLLLAGDGPLRESYSSLISDLKLEDRVKLLGWRRDVANLFKTADICLFPSRYEPNGNVVHEAWLFKTPLIAAKSDGPAWLIDHEKNGILVDIDDIAGFQSAINKVLHDQQFTDALITHGHEKFKKELSKEVIIEKYRDLFTHLQKR